MNSEDYLKIARIARVGYPERNGDWETDSGFFCFFGRCAHLWRIRNKPSPFGPKVVPGLKVRGTNKAQIEGVAWMDIYERTCGSRRWRRVSNKPDGEDNPSSPPETPSDTFSIQAVYFPADEGFERPLQHRRPIEVLFDI